MNNIFWFISLVFMDSICWLISMPKVVIFYHAIIILNGCTCGCNSAQQMTENQTTQSSSIALKLKKKKKSYNECFTATEDKYIRN